MEIEVKKTVENEEYEQFLKKNTNVTFFHSKKHLNFLSNILELEPKFIVARKQKEITGIIPFFIKRSVYGNVINSLPFFGSHGGIISEDHEIMKPLLEFLNNFNKENDVLSSVLITNPFTKDNTPYEKFYNFNFKETRLTQCTILQNENKNTLWDKLEKRTRYTIKKSKTDAVVSTEVKIEDCEKDFYKMYKTGMETKSSNLKPPHFFQSIKNNFSQGKDYDIFMASNNSEPIAYLLVFYYNGFTEYYMPAFNLKWKNLNGISNLIWKSIEKSFDTGMDFYNFGGTLDNQKSLYLFKRGWNSTDFNYNYYIFSDLDRLKHADVNELKKHYQYFYVFSYEKILSTQNHNSDINFS